MKSYAVTDVGVKRTVNQDSFYCSDERVGILPNCYIVADGMGGHNAGDFASRFVVDAFLSSLRSSSERTQIQAIEEAVISANEGLIEKAKGDRDLDGMGTTFVMATINEDNELLAANIGDSRLYLICDGNIRQITMDHSLVAEMVRKGEIRKEEARFHPQKNVVLKAISTRGMVTPDFYRLKVKPGTYILLCSDGLSDMLDESELLRVISDYEDVSDIAEKMVALANENGGKDNISIVLLRV